MSIEAISVVMSARVGDATSKLVLLAYANHAGRDGRAAWPSKAVVAEYAEVDPKTVQRHLRKLERAGWLRRGDQELVSHYRADRRPVVYDVAMSEEARADWAREATQRGDGKYPRAVPSLSTPVDNSTGRVDILSPREGGHGGTAETSRGDTAVSPKPSRTKNNPPHPPAADAAGGAKPTNTPPTPGIGTCRRHPTGGSNCRACGTTPRQLAAAAERQRRLDDADARIRDQIARRRIDPVTQPPIELINQTRARLRNAHRPATGDAS